MKQKFADFHIALRGYDIVGRYADLKILKWEAYHLLSEEEQLMLIKDMHPKLILEERPGWIKGVYIDHMTRKEKKAYMEKLATEGAN